MLVLHSVCVCVCMCVIIAHCYLLRCSVEGSTRRSTKSGRARTSLQQH